MAHIGGAIWHANAVALTFNPSAVSAQFDVIHGAIKNINVEIYGTRVMP